MSPVIGSVSQYVSKNCSNHAVMRAFGLHAKPKCTSSTVTTLSAIRDTDPAQLTTPAFGAGRANSLRTLVSHRCIGERIGEGIFAVFSYTGVERVTLFG